MRLLVPKSLDHIIPVIFLSSLGCIQPWAAVALQRLFKTQNQPLPWHLQVPIYIPLGEEKQLYRETLVLDSVMTRNLYPGTRRYPFIYPWVKRSNDIVNCLAQVLWPGANFIELLKQKSCLSTKTARLVYTCYWSKFHAYTLLVTGI